MPLPLADVEHAWHKFYAFVRPETLAAGWSRDRIMAEVNAAWVPDDFFHFPFIFPISASFLISPGSHAVDGDETQRRMTAKGCK